MKITSDNKCPKCGNCCSCTIGDGFERNYKAIKSLGGYVSKEWIEIKCVRCGYSENVPPLDDKKNP